MADPTLGLTFRDLQIRVAEYLGVADYSGGTAAPPSDPHDLELVKRLVNDGYRRFIAANPRWQWLTPLITITFDPTGAGSQCVAGDASRYYMPDGFYGSLVEPFTYGSTGPRVYIRAVNEAVIRALQSAGTASGYPTLVALRPLAVTAASTGQRWEAVFWPTPGADYTVTARARLFPDKLVNDTDRPISGFQHDQAVLYAALAEAEKLRHNKAGLMEQSWQQALAAAARLDMEAAPRRQILLIDPSDDVAPVQLRQSSGVFTHNGVPV
jgi:hypothetical protein